ncbi:MAG: cytochrome c [Flavobacteriaceae bacterium]|nr:cytochrome c [Flavobacteriaceae bacterium]
MKNLLNISFIGLFLVLFISCNSDKSTKRSIQYMSETDMYTPVPYDTYTDNPYFKNGLSAQLPVEGTIARGTVVYDYPNSEEGYQMAKDSLKSPIIKNEKSLEKGKKNYDIYCAICHGKTGDGQGDLVKNEKFLGVPNYKDRDITQGSTYHVIMYGRNMMGSHASQLTDKERWEVVQYVDHLRADLLK